MKDKLILDACCGSRMFWFDRMNEDVVYLDKRTESHILCDGRSLEITPDVEADFTDLPFADNSFYMVVFDPPHLHSLGQKRWMALKYGVLPKNWQPVILKGFQECMRVVKPFGTVIFKWNEHDVKLSELLKILPYKPLFGHTTGRQSKTKWLTFMKINNNECQ